MSGSVLRVVACLGIAACAGSPAGDLPPDAPPIVDDGTIVAVAVASRTTGVAPLAVQLDATATTGGARPFHELHYAWRFDDTDSGTWPETGHPRDAATGPIAAHVFERAGTYAIQLTVRDARGVGSTAAVTVTVLDPEVVFADQTTCVATGTDFAGCPAGAAHLTTTDGQALAPLVQAGRRVLLRRGDRWTVPDTLELDDGAPGHLGAFGACVEADPRGLCANAPRLDPDPTSGAVLRVAGDWRIADLSLTAPAREGEGPAIDIWPGTGTLVLRTRIRGFELGIGAADLEARGDQLALVSNDVGEGYNYQVAVGAERLMILGNHFHDSQISHVLRVWQAFKSVIAENLLANASLASDLGRHALKLHGIGDAQVAAGEPATGFVVVADNTFGASPPWPVSIGPENNAEPQRVRDVVFERNFWRSAGPHFGDQTVSTALHCMAMGDVTIRNNVFDATGAGDFFAAVDVSRGPQFTGEVDDVHVLHNTLHRDRGATRIAFARVEPDVRATVVRNNLGYAPGAVGEALEYDRGNATVARDNAFADLAFAVAAPTHPREFAPLPATSWVDVAAPGLVVEDYAGRVRDGAPDLGAFEHVPAATR